MINEVALAKLQKYCAYQERCHKEVRSKLLTLKVYGDDLEEIISELINDNFLNEERYAITYARGKFRMKRWGRNKIKQNLKFNQISSYCIKKAMEEIDEQEYLDTLNTILQKQIDKNNKYEDIVARHKAIQYAISRGYETSIVYDQIKKIKTD
jgi:regulatory protein